MNLEQLDLQQADGYWTARHPCADTLNETLAQCFVQHEGDADVRRTHHFNGRFENTYINAERLPVIQPLLTVARTLCEALHGAQDCERIGFWFNAMRPGNSTSRHCHDENDEVMSGVYYVQAPEGSGDLVLHLPGGPKRIKPKAGAFVLFPPGLEHETDAHGGDGLRLSVAFNLGPAAAP